jgi:hypothetical protein
LRQTAQLNQLDNLVVHEVAVMRGSGKAILRRYRGDSGTNEGMNYICEDTGKPDVERVQTICLDEFCRECRIERIDLLKGTSKGTSIPCCGAPKALLGLDEWGPSLWSSIGRTTRGQIVPR